MGQIKTLWASIQGSPTFMRKLNGWLTVAWFLMMPVAIATHWIYSVVFVSVVSIYANFTGHLSAWQASRVEERQDKDADVREVLDRLPDPSA